MCSAWGIAWTVRLGDSSSGSSTAAAMTLVRAGGIGGGGGGERPYGSTRLLSSFPHLGVLGHPLAAASCPWPRGPFLPCQERLHCAR